MSNIQNPGTGGGGGSGTVTSVAGGTGITNSPEPIVGAGTVNLDIDSLTTAAALAAGDLFALVDISAGGSAIANQRKTTLQDIADFIGSSGGATCATAPELLCLGGRTGITNDPTISTDADGTIYGSASPTNALLLASSSAVTTPEVRITTGLTFSGESFTVGNPTPAGFFPFVVAEDFNVSGTSATLAGFTLNGGMAVSTTIFGIGGTGSFAAITTSGDFDNLLNISGIGIDADNNFVFQPIAASVLFAVDGPPGSGFVPGQVVFLTTGRDAESHNRFWIKHDGDTGIGNNVGYPEGKLHIRGVDPAVVVTVIQSTTGEDDQTANLTDWEGRIYGVTIPGDVSPGATSIFLVDSTAFPASGVIYIANGDSSIGSDLPLEYTANNTGTGEITLLNPTTFNTPGDNPVYVSTLLTSVDAAGMVSRYMGILTAGRGVPAIHESVGLTTQTATIGDTSLANTDVAGVYRVSVYAVTTTGDLAAGSISVDIKYTDDAVAQTVTVGPVLLTVTGNFAQQTIFVETASGDITYGVTNGGGFGTADYSLYVVAERL